MVFPWAWLNECVIGVRILVPTSCLPSIFFKVIFELGFWMVEIMPVDLPGVSDAYRPVDFRSMDLLSLK